MLIANGKCKYIYTKLLASRSRSLKEKSNLAKEQAGKNTSRKLQRENIMGLSP